MPLIKAYNLVFCQKDSPSLGSCRNSFLSTCTTDMKRHHLDDGMIPDIMRQLSYSASTKQFKHFIQLIGSEKFAQFDYKEGNLNFYNSSTPPDYPLNKIKATMYLYTGSYDILVSLKDIEHLKKLITSVVNHRNIKSFNHCDFVYGNTTQTVLYNDILSKINSS